MSLRNVLYLESDGTQYIDTGINASSGIEFEIKIERYNNSTGWGHIIGAITDSSDLMCIFGIKNWGEYLTRNGSGDILYGNYSFALNTYYTIKLVSGVLYINGVAVKNVPTSTYTTAVSLYLFAAHYQNAANSNATVRIYHCKIWDNGTLVRDYIPAVDNETAGLYDRVSGSFNSGHGTFSYGDIAWKIGDDGYPVPTANELEMPSKVFVTPVPLTIWNESDDGPARGIFKDLPEKVFADPLPDSVWRCTKYIESGYPYHNLMPDLEYAEPDYKYECIRLLDNVRVVSYPHGLNRLFPVTKMEIPLDKPENTTYTLNFKKTSTLTGNIAKTNMDTWRQLREQPTLTTMLASAQANATQLITSAMGGYVTLVHNEEGIITEIVIADEADYLQAQNIWRWNTGGLGFSSHGYQGPYEAAITMDGSIVASMITAGTMYADRIHGGILTMGGVDNVNGIIQVRKGNGDLACKFDKDGGWIHGRLYTEDDNDNWMNVIDGYIYGGNGSNTYATIDIANEYDIGESDTKGLGFIAPIIGLNCKHLLISDNGRDLYKAKTQTVRVVSDISVDSDGKVTSVTKKDLQFKNGILVSVDNV